MGRVNRDIEGVFVNIVGNEKERVSAGPSVIARPQLVLKFLSGVVFHVFDWLLLVHGECAHGLVNEFRGVSVEIIPPHHGAKLRE